MDRPNIIFLSADALRSDRMSAYGYDRPTTPNIDRLLSDSIVCEQSFSLAAFTQGSFPTILTSSRPLSYGGFDNLARGRPKTLFRHFRDHGYWVTSLNTFKWVSRFYGFEDAFDEEFFLFLPQQLTGAAVNRITSTIQSGQLGTLDECEVLQMVSGVIYELFDQLEEYCTVRLDQRSTEQNYYAETNLIKSRLRLESIRSSAAKHRQEFETGPRAYLTKYLEPLPRAHEWVSADWRSRRSLVDLAIMVVDRVWSRLLNIRTPGIGLARNNRFKQFADGAALTDHICQIIGNYDRPEPFFLWTHFLDCHLPYMPGRAPDWYRTTDRYLRPLGYSTSPDLGCLFKRRPESAEELETWRHMYDAAILYFDEQVGRVLKHLEDTGLRENTILILTSDHGEELGEHGNFNHYFRFYEHNVKVPMIFSPPNHSGANISALTSLLDIAPTISALAGLEPVPEWDGLAVTDPSVGARDHLIMETFYGGNCIFESRAIYMAVRTQSYKYIWKEFLDPDDQFSPPGPELYDLQSDPGETLNLADERPKLVADFNQKISNRLMEIPEVDPSRYPNVINDKAAKAAR